MKNAAKAKDNKNAAKNPKAMRKTIQRDVLKFQGMTQDGILVTGQGYSVMYRFPEVNFITETDETQLQIAEQYSAFMNAIPDDMVLQIVIVNIHTTEEELANSYHLPLTGRKTDQYVEDYNNIIDAKLKEGANDIRKEKYAVLTAKTHSLKEAKAMFQTAEAAMQDKMKAISGTQLIRMDALERVMVMKNITCGTEERIPFEREYSRYIDTEVDNEDRTHSVLSLAKMKRTRGSIKDIVAPPLFEKVNGGIRIGEKRYLKTYVIPELPPSLDTRFVTSISQLDHEMVTILRFAPMPRAQANKTVKNMNVNIKADVQKDTRKALQAGLDPEVTLSEDLIYKREEAATLRKDVIQDGKRLFVSAITTTLFAEDTESLNKIYSEYKSRCADNTVTPNPLYGLQTEALRDTMLLGMNEVLEMQNRLLTSDDVRAINPWNIQDIQDRQHGLFYGTNAVSGNAQMINRRYLAPAGNGLIFGTTGSGKSFFVKCEITTNYLSSDADEFIILDPENEFTPLALAYDGAVVDLSQNSETHINPLDMNMEWGNRDASPLSEKCDLMVSIVESILGNHRECNAYQVSAIHQATEKIYAPYIQTMNARRDNSEDPANEPDIDPSICPTLVDFYHALVEQQSMEGNQIAQAIQPYCLGQYNTFAHHTNIDIRARICVFQLVHLPEKMKEMAMKVCLSHIWTRVVRNQYRNQKLHAKKRLWIYLDEFHLFMQTESSRTSLTTYYKRVRKFNAIMTGITQDVNDIVSDVKSQTIFNNSGFFVYFHQESDLALRAIQAVNGNNISDALIDYVKNKGGIGVGLLKANGSMVPLNFVIPKNSLMYKLATTKLED